VFATTESDLPMPKVSVCASALRIMLSAFCLDLIFGSNEVRPVEHCRG
jgi:hypothetical protein